MSMSNFDKFMEKFKETYPMSDRVPDIDKFMYNVFYSKNGENPLHAELKKDNDTYNHDSYGNEDSTLQRVFYFPEFSIFVMFKGTRQSYNGEEWNDIREVKPITKTIEVYE